MSFELPPSPELVEARRQEARFAVANACDLLTKLSGMPVGPTTGMGTTPLQDAKHEAMKLAGDEFVRAATAYKQLCSSPNETNSPVLPTASVT